MTEKTKLLIGEVCKLTDKTFEEIEAKLEEFKLESAKGTKNLIERRSKFKELLSSYIFIHKV